LEDIKYVLNPTFTKDAISALDRIEKHSRAIDGTLYVPGIIGLNNIKANDYCNVVLQVCVLQRGFPCLCLCKLENLMAVFQRTSVHWPI
jgi:hypothetical protein